jgi:hypothetical protein
MQTNKNKKNLRICKGGEIIYEVYITLEYNNNNT